jgi:hypothetical protein
MIEMVVASMLATLLGVLMAVAWATFGRPALEVEARARIAQEAIMAAESLSRDLGGFVADTEGRGGTLSQYRFVDWDLSYGNPLLLNFQGTGPGDPIVIRYEYDSQKGKLARSNSSTGVQTIIAAHVTGFSVTPDPNNANLARIELTITYRRFSGTYVLIGVKPS